MKDVKINFSNYCGQLCEVVVTKEWLDNLRKKFYEPGFYKLNLDNGIKTFQHYVRAVLMFSCR